MASDDLTLTLPPVPIYQIAKNLALYAHKDQKYGNRPYSDHLAAVAHLLIKQGNYLPDELAAAWLHDVLEDTAITKEQMVGYVGHLVTDLVWELTDRPKELNDKSQNLYFKRLSCMSRAAKRLKLLDLAANMAACCEDRHDYLIGYAKNFPRYRDALMDEGMGVGWGPAGPEVYKSIYLAYLTGMQGKTKYGYWYTNPEVRDGLVVGFDPVFEEYAGTTKEVEY